ncbi:MAG: DUF3035 domain-containing protein [Geminicoccaceae bacterium]|nr:DUF3035 domain-containing protein [Geminicoccaceae bacterium]
MIRPSRSTIGLVIGAGLLMTGCSGSLGDTLGFGKRAPDEFAVVKRQPLIVPPDYDLRPPDPNARGPLPRRADARARSALTGVPVDERGGGSAADVAAGSAGEAALIRRSAEVPSDPSVRTRIAEEAGGAAPVDDALFERLVGQEPAVPEAAGEASASSGSEPGASDELTLIRRSSTQLEN